MLFPSGGCVSCASWQLGLPHSACSGYPQVRASGGNLGCQGACTQLEGKSENIFWSGNPDLVPQIFREISSAVAIRAHACRALVLFEVLFWATYEVGPIWGNVWGTSTAVGWSSSPLSQRVPGECFDQIGDLVKGRINRWQVFKSDWLSLRYSVATPCGLKCPWCSLFSFWLPFVSAFSLF